MQASLKRPTLHDVAEMAGVAVSTASSILNERSDSWSSQQTRDRVFAAVRALHYKPNRMARALRLNHFQAATLVVPDLTNPFFAILARAFQRAMEQAGYDLLIEDTEEDPEKEKRVLNDVASHNTDGVILVLSNPVLHAERLEELSRTFPVVMIGSPMPNSRIDTVQSDLPISLHKMIDHLVRLGHRSIGFVDSMAGRNDGIERMAFFREALKRSGLVFDERNWVRCRHEVAEVRVATGQWASEMSAGERSSAFICTNDLTALGTIRGLLDAGLSVPDDVSVVGFDDIPLVSYLPRPLTTIAQPVAQMAAAASQTLLDRICGKLLGPATHQIFATSLIVRESSAAPPTT